MFGYKLSKDQTILNLVRRFWFLLATSFIFMALFAGLLTYIQNENAVDTSEHLFRTALQDRSDRLSELVLEYAYWDDAVEHLVGGVDQDWVSSNIVPYLHESLGVAGVLVLDGAGRPILAGIEGELTEIDPVARYGPPFAALVADARSVPDDAAPVPVAGILRHGADHYLASAARMTTYLVVDGTEVDRSTDHVMVFVEPLDDRLLEGIAQSYLLPRLRIADAPDGLWTGALQFDIYGGGDGAYFVWEPSLPGTDMLPKLLAALAVVFGLMLVIARSFVRRADQATRALEATRLDAQRANQAKTEFMRNVAHELRTPANAIIGFAGIMRQEMFGPLGHAKYAGYVEDISTAGDHMLGLVNDLLDLDRIEAGEMEFVVERLSGNDAMVSAASYVSELAAGKGVEVVLDFAEALPEVDTDPRALRQVLLNLLSNAVKFTPAGGRVVCRTYVHGSGGLALQVGDSGPGLSGDQIEKALRPFGQVVSVEGAKYRGTGLGLPISKRLTEALGGLFQFESVVGTGTTVTIVLPSRG